MKIVINDANILIDLALVDLIEAFSQLNFDLYTTDFVYSELNEPQQKLFSSLIQNGFLKIIETTEMFDYREIERLLNSAHGLSPVDCSVWHYSSKMSGMLLSGDAKLRKHARSSGVEVKGIIYLYNELLRQGLITFSIAIEKITQLSQLNTRLTRSEIAKRLDFWSRNKMVD